MSEHHSDDGVDVEVWKWSIFSGERRTLECDSSARSSFGSECRLPYWTGGEIRQTLKPFVSETHGREKLVEVDIRKWQGAAVLPSLGNPRYDDTIRIARSSNNMMSSKTLVDDDEHSILRSPQGRTRMYHFLRPRVHW